MPDFVTSEGGASIPPPSDDGLEPVALEYVSDLGNPLAMLIGLVTVVLALATVWLVWTS